MYIPKHFEEPRKEVLHNLIRTRPLATLITVSSHGLEANHVPLHLAEDGSPLGTLRGHVARANPIWTDNANNMEALAIFHGPNAYISPSWYPSKKETGKVVPTWNYVAVHAYGVLRAIDDASWLRSQLESFTAQQEAAFDHPWHVSDAPREYTETMIAAIVGIELEITRLQGKWKMSQNQSPLNRKGASQGLRQRGSREDLDIAALIEETRKNPNS
jgi:transcriptional regulator